MRHTFDFMGLRHIHDTLSDDPIEEERFRTAVVDSYANRDAGDFDRGQPILENTQRRVEREGLRETEAMVDHKSKLEEILAGGQI